MKEIAIDLGYSNTKVFDGEHAIKFPSIFMRCYDDNYVPAEKDDMLLSLHDEKYHIGQVAMDKGGEAAYDKNDIFRHELFILAAICRTTEDFSGTVYAGLPIGDMKALSPMLARLKGTYEIMYNGNPRTIVITKIKVSAQGESVVNLLKKQDEEINDEVVGIVDIGQKTVDFALFENGTYVDARSGSIDFGIINAYSEIAKSLETRVGITKEDYKIKRELDLLPKRAEKNPAWNDVKADSERIFKDLAQSIRNRLFARHWNFKELDRLYIVGGGAYYLREYFEDAPLEDFKMPEFANAVAFFTNK